MERSMDDSSGSTRLAPGTGTGEEYGAPGGVALRALRGSGGGAPRESPGNETRFSCRDPRIHVQFRAVFSINQVEGKCPGAVAMRSVSHSPVPCENPMRTKPPSPPRPSSLCWTSCPTHLLQGLTLLRETREV